MSTCVHPRAHLDDAISHLGDPEWAFCYGCMSVLRAGDRGWEVQSAISATPEPIQTDA